ncbi:hypothetical protein CLV33_106137 [Jejuia pallidilutea]|uniref:Uncharacterized protein n=1 Tax=Jejuia pallidilutea TaxID=504487 RepID=A0A362XBB4_9FLAO|nr:hypothetical protein [Jejuia pallidilutea]PQV47818.1 hypothetical protein CLV33_106137 [Jejuia pallidilutea]
MKKTILYILFAFYIFSLNQSCEKEQQSDNEIGNKDVFTLMTNGSDPLLLNVKKNDGSSINVYCDRGSDGIPTNVTQFTFGESADSENIFQLDNKSRISYMQADNGVQFYLDWQGETTFNLTVISTDGETTINTEVDLNDNTGKSSFNSSKNRNQINYSNGNGMNSVKLSIYECDEVSKSIYHKPKIIIKESAGGDNRSDFLRTYYPKQKELGVAIYEVDVPNDTAPSVNLSELCKAVNDILSPLCTVQGFSNAALLTTISNSLSVVIAASGIGVVPAAILSTATNSLYGALSTYCGTLGFSAGDSASIADKICGAEKLNFSIYEDLVIYASINSLPSNILSNITTNPGQGPYEDLVIDLGDDGCIDILSYNQYSYDCSNGNYSPLGPYPIIFLDDFTCGFSDYQGCSSTGTYSFDGTNLSYTIVFNCDETSAGGERTTQTENFTGVLNSDGSFYGDLNIKQNYPDRPQYVETDCKGTISIRN